MRLRAERNQDLRRYNLPTANNEVAVIIPGDGSENVRITVTLFLDSQEEALEGSAIFILHTLLFTMLFLSTW